ncbi:MAG: septum formation initiator family protein [Firmicutes bacterium]|nr:septum formation initiator family protein [Bacillota bacterium]
MAKKNLKLKTNFFVKAAIFTFLFFCVVTIVSQQFQFNEIRKSKESLEKEINTLNLDIEELNDTLSQPVDERYIKRVARAMLDYHMPEEILFYNDLIK